MTHWFIWLNCDESFKCLPFRETCECSVPAFAYLHHITVFETMKINESTSFSTSFFTIHTLWCILLQRATPTSSEPSLSRSGTMLLELKRRHVSQRLNELQLTLGRIRRRQQRGSESREGTGGRKQTGSSSSTKPGEREQYPGIDGCSSADGQQQGGVPASRSHSQENIQGRALGSNKVESHISAQQRSNNSEMLLDCQMLESQDQPLVTVPGNQELNDRITIENTTGHTDSDDMWAACWSETGSECGQTLRRISYIMNYLTVTPPPPGLGSKSVYTVIFCLFYVCVCVGGGGWGGGVIRSVVFLIICDPGQK